MVDKVQMMTIHLPKVSVILTSFNHEKYLREAIDSVINQTFSDFELIIWDDASSDNSWEIIQSYQDPRIKSFRNDEQRRGVYGINKAISEVAKGEYIAIHHSDDVWELEKLKCQVAYLDEHPKIVGVFTWVRAINEMGDELPLDWFNVPNQSQTIWLRQLFNGENHLNHPSAMIRHLCYQDVGLYRYGLAQTGDAEMWSRILIKYPIYVITKKLTRHRIFSDLSNASGARHSVKVRLSNEWNVLRKNYYSKNDANILFDIFPSISKYKKGDKHNCRFLLAMGALLECEQPSGWQFGLELLYELMRDNESRHNIECWYSFTYSDLIKLAATFDPFDITCLGKASDTSKIRAEKAEAYARELETELKAYKAQAMKYAEQIETSEARQSDMASQVQALQQGLRAATAESQAYRTQINEASKSMEEYAAYARELETELKAYKAQAMKYAEQIETSVARQSDMASQVQALQQGSRAATAESQAYRTQINEASKSMEEYAAYARELETELKAYKAQAMKYAEQIETSEARQSDMASYIQALQQGLKAAAAESQAYRTQIDEASKRMEEYAAYARELETELKAYKAQAMKYAEQIETSEARQSDMASQVQALQQGLRAATAESQAYRTQIDEAFKRMQEVEENTKILKE
jgi:glycosyltransferase involved in cell wall biosynthesis